jgi:FkbM family methyltransferase
MIGSVIVRLFGRRLAWRLGRAIYMEARGEVANAIASNGEAALARAVVSAVDPAHTLTVWDVGANLGEWSQIVVDACSHAGREFRLELFEPVPATQAALEARFAGNAVVRLHRCALSREAGEGQMDIVSPTGGTNALLTEGARAGTDIIAVQIETGDAMRARLGQDRIDLIKIDAEGHDLDILRGLSAALGEGAIGVVQFEYNHRWVPTGASLFQVFRLIADLPYRLGRVTAGGIELMPHWHPEADRFLECNYALVREDMLACLDCREGIWDESNVLQAAAR